MNGFMMCVLLAATGQVGDTPERDYGWQINPVDGKLEYIVQLSPEKANYMVSASKEQESEVPADVAARLSRVVVRIGTEPLVSTPLEEVRKLPVVTTAVLANIEATAGRGRFSQLESAPAGEVRNVSGDKAPLALPGGPSTPLPEPPGASLADQASQLGSNLGQAIQNDLSEALSSRGSEALRQAETLLAKNLAQNPAGTQFLSDSRGVSTGTGKFSSTATQPATPPAGSPASQLPGAPSGAIGPTQPTGNYPTSPAHNHAPGDPYHNDGTAAAPPINSTIGNPATSGLGAGGSSVGGWANTATNAAGTAGQPYNGANGAYAGSAYNPPPGYNNTVPGYGTPAPGYNSGPNSGMTPVTNGNFGGVPRGAQNQPAYNQPAYNQYATVGNGAGSQYPYNSQSTPPYSSGSSAPGYGGPSSPYASDPLALPRLDQPTRIADSRTPTSLPSTSSGALAGSGENARGTSTSKTGKGRAADVQNDGDAADSYANSHSGIENILPVMFVLSLVVNFYLGMLIRKLLGRYRSLLSSVRSQAV